MSQHKVVMSYADLLKWTESDGVGNRIEVLQLPHDPSLSSRYILSVAGPHSAQIMNMITDALDVYFTKEVAAHQELTDSHGPESSAPSPD